MFSLFGRNKLSSAESVDVIQKIVYDFLKPLGFRRHGRVMHRFVDGDISQVVELQNGCPEKGVAGVLWVNLGIRVPECAEQTFTPPAQKNYYHEYECNIRVRLGEYVDGRDLPYDLKCKPETIGGDIAERLDMHVMPVFDTLSSRAAILARRREFSRFDSHNRHLIELEEAMIHGRAGDPARAETAFGAYYSRCRERYLEEVQNGRKQFMRRGERMTYRNAATGEVVTVEADRTGEVVLYDASDAHLKYLEELAGRLGIALPEM